MTRHLYDASNPMSPSNGVDITSHIEVKCMEWTVAQSAAYLLITTLILIALLTGCQQQQHIVRIGTAIHTEQQKGK